MRDANVGVPHNRSDRGDIKLLEGTPQGVVAPSKFSSMKFNECWAEIDGQKMRYLQAGTGPPLLLIHGLLGGSFCWRLTMPELAQQHAVYAVDLPGTSQTGGRGMDCSMACQAERLARFVRQMGWKDLGVIGSSFGGAIAMLLASQILAKIRLLVLVSPVNPWSDFGRGRIGFLSSRFGGWFLRMTLPISHPCHGIALRRMYGDPRRIPEGTLEGYRASILHPGRAANVLTALRNWQRDVEALRTVIPQLDVPALLIWGTKDGAVDPRSAEKLRRELPHARLEWIHGAGHLPFEEMPEEFSRAVLAFLGSKGRAFSTA